MAQATGVDLVGEIRDVLAGSMGPLTLSRIKKALPVPFQAVSVECLGDVMRRQVAANVFVLFPRYRSRKDRYWDRPVGLHLEQLLRKVLRHGPLPWSEIRRRLPGYAKIPVEAVLEVQVARGRLFRHPPAGRLGARYGLSAADPRAYLEPELDALLRRLEGLGFSRRQLRASALNILREEERHEVPAPRRTAATVNYIWPRGAFTDVLDGQLVPMGES